MPTSRVEVGVRFDHQRSKSRVCRRAPPETHSRSHRPACKYITQHRLKGESGGKAPHTVKRKVEAGIGNSGNGMLIGGRIFNTYHHHICY